MHSIKENVSCKSNLTVAIQRQHITTKKKSSKTKLIYTPIDKQNDTDNRFYELKVGDPSRNVIEMIFKAALSSTNPKKQQSRRIDTVLKVKNSFGTVKKFEIYREMIKNKAYEMNPRNMVDGNELLKFYSTTMPCFHGDSDSYCENPDCGVCRMIQNNHMEIQLSSSITTSGNLKKKKKKKNVQKAVIICRIIAGKVGNMVDRENQDYDSLYNNNTDNLIVQNPNAVLPCFVILFT